MDYKELYSKCKNDYIKLKYNMNGGRAYLDDNDYLKLFDNIWTNGS